MTTRTRFYTGMAAWFAAVVPMAIVQLGHPTPFVWLLIPILLISGMYLMATNS